jgi:hypothetical protein
VQEIQAFEDLPAPVLQHLQVDFLEPLQVTARQANKLVTQGQTNLQNMLTTHTSEQEMMQNQSTQLLVLMWLCHKVKEKDN